MPSFKDTKLVIIKDLIFNTQEDINKMICTNHLIPIGISCKFYIQLFAS